MRARMQPNPGLNRLDRLGNSGSAPSVFGSTVAKQFIKDAIAGTASLDIVIIGDSNAGRNYNGGGGGGGGHLRGTQNALLDLGATIYATSIAPVMTTAGSNEPLSLVVDADSTTSNTSGFDFLALKPTGNLLSGRAAYPNSHLVPGEYLVSGFTCTTSAVLANVLTVGGSITGSLVAGMRFVSSGISVIVGTQLTGTTGLAGTYNSTGTTTHAGGGAGVGSTIYSAQPFGMTGFDFAVVANGTTFATNSRLVETYPNQASPSPALPAWCAPASHLSYRGVLVQLDQVNSPGSVETVAYNYLGNTLLKKWDGTTNALDNWTVDGGYWDMQFTVPSPAGSSGMILGWAYPIGAGNDVTGPATVWCQSVYLPHIGIASNSFHVGSGQTSTIIAGVIAQTWGGGSTFMESFLQELVTRQSSAVSGDGASSRILMVISFGINDNANTYSASDITTNFEATVDTISNAWDAIGQDPTLISYLCIVSHPLDTDYGDSGAKEAMLAAYRSAANAWVLTLSPSLNVTVVDASKVYNAARMTANGMYEGAGASEAHLSQSGYRTFWTGIFNALRRS